MFNVFIKTIRLSDTDSQTKKQRRETDSYKETLAIEEHFLRPTPFLLPPCHTFTPSKSSGGWPRELELSRYSAPCCTPPPCSIFRPALFWKIWITPPFSCRDVVFDSAHVHPT